MATPQVSMLGAWVLVVLGAIIFVVSQQSRSRKKLKLPPGPPAWPILGSLPYFGNLPKDLLSLNLALAKKYGSIFIFWLGKHPVVVVTSLILAEEVLKHKDSQFTARPSQETARLGAKYMGYGGTGITYSDASDPQHQFLKKVCVTQFFSASKLAATDKVRTEEIGRAMEGLIAASGRGETVNIRDLIHQYTVNTMFRILFGETLAEMNLPGVDPKTMLSNFLAEHANLQHQFSVTNLCPILEFLDPQKIIAGLSQLSVRMGTFYTSIMSRRRQQRRNKDTQENFADVLMDLLDQKQISENTLFAVMSDMMVAGLETSAGSIEWGLLELAKNPPVLSKLQAEIDAIVGSERIVTDEDTKNLPYLHAVVKEVFRLHPVAPLGFIHTNRKPTTIGGYDIPAGSTVMVGIYAMTHDPKNYPERTLEFNPSRFETAEGRAMSALGNDFKLIPFSSGRRRCPADSFGHLQVHRTLASLAHAFDWSPPPGKTVQDLDTSECMANILKPTTCPVLSPIPRPAARHYMNMRA